MLRSAGVKKLEIRAESTDASEFTAVRMLAAAHPETRSPTGIDRPFKNPLGSPLVTHAQAMPRGNAIDVGLRARKDQAGGFNRVGCETPRDVARDARTSCPRVIRDE
jgi:hypothetical protein